MSKPEPTETARAFVSQHYPNAQQAWLSGSVVLGGATSTSDLDITVLMGDARAHRATAVYEEWPVEVFVHTEASLRWFVARDLARRRPTMARLVAQGVALLPGDEGNTLRDECAAVLTAGPDPLADSELVSARFNLTDLLDDLTGCVDRELLDAVAVDVWRSTAELHLASNRAWTGTSKWLVRELRQLDDSSGADVTARLHLGLHAALAGDINPLLAVADEVLNQVGGRIWAGLQLEAPARPAPTA